MSDSVLLTSLDNGVLTLTLNRPKALNALNGELGNALREAVADAADNPKVRCLVICGGKHFMAGGDIAEFSGLMDLSPKEKREHFEGFIEEAHKIITGLRRMPKPVLACVNGAVAGFGLSLMLACDMVIAADDAMFTLAYVNLGATPDGGSTYGLPRAVGAKKAAEIAFLGDRFDAETARDWSLINWIVGIDELDAETTRIAERLAAGPANVIGRTKALLEQSINATLEEQLQAESDSFAQSASEDDFAEGVTAFMKNRKPAFGNT